MPSNIALRVIYRKEPVPAQRPRFDSVRGRTYTPAKYDKYKRGLAKAIQLQAGPFIPPPAPGSKERAKELKQNRYFLTLMVYRKRNVGDGDNYLKSVQDALQDAGVIIDDSQIDIALVDKRFIDKVDPRVELELIQL